jgi:phospholipase A1
LVLLGAVLTVFCPAAGEAMGKDKFEECMTNELMQAGDHLTVGDLKKICREKAPPPEVAEGKAKPESLMAKRRQQEAETDENPFAITPHKTNYILVASYNNTPNAEPFLTEFPNAEEDIDHTEIKFQLSLKFPIFKDTFIKGSDFYVAYTNRSFWQAYNDLSAPFRDINHEPEAWLAFENDWQLLGFDNRQNDFGFVHQSNGRGGTLSRSWNRIYANFLFEKGNGFINLKPWYRIPEDEKSDNNPDIHEYLGYGELTGAYKWGGHTFSLLLRNNLQTTENRGAAQIDWSFPFREKLRWYFQYFTGYGESLIDYNASSDSIGVGIQLTDWF